MNSIFNFWNILFTNFDACISLISLFNYNKAIDTVNNEDAKYKITPDESNNVAKDIIIADEERQKYIEKFYNQEPESQDIFSMITSSPPSISNNINSPQQLPNTTNIPTQQLPNTTNIPKQESPNTTNIPTQQSPNIIANFSNYSSSESSQSLKKPQLTPDTIILTKPNEGAIPSPTNSNVTAPPSSSISKSLKKDPESKSSIKLAFSDYNEDNNTNNFDNYYNYSAFTN